MSQPLTSAASQRSSAEMIADQRRFLFPCVATYYEQPLVLRRGSGCRVEDVEGRSYLDLFGGILTTSLGHCHPEILAAVEEQSRRLGHVSTLYVNEPQIETASRLAALAPGDLSCSFFTNSGTEAVETAVQLACQYTGRTEIVTLRLAYSGRSVLATNLTAHAPWRPLPATVAGIHHALAPYPYRCPFCKGPCRGDCAEAFADDLAQVIETTTNGRPAAFIAETILGVGGFIVPPPGYFELAAQIIRDAGGLFICDEVQAGFGRTGRHWFGIEHWNVVPDILVMAKGIANGAPVGATVTTPDIAAAWKAKTISTFGGNPVSMAAARATLDVMRREDVPRRAEARGGQLRAGLDELAKRHEKIGEVRGMGLMQGLELVTDRQTREPDPQAARALLEASRAEGLLIGLGGLRGNVVRIGPSLLIGEDELDDGLRRLSRALDRIA